MENNNVNVMEDVQEVLTTDNVIEGSPKSRTKIAMGIGLGVFLGTMVYKKIVKPRLQAKFGIQEVIVESVESEEDVSEDE